MVSPLMDCGLVAPLFNMCKNNLWGTVIIFTFLVGN
jgi:hypothetical protein